MPIGRPGNVQMIDPLLAWELWAKLGSLNKVADELGKRGIINPLTGKQPAALSVRGACWRYAAKHPEEIRKKYFEPALLELGEVCTDDRWNFELYKNVRFLYFYSNKKKFERFMKLHPELEKYRTYRPEHKKPDSF